MLHFVAHLQSQNDYLREWIPRRDKYLQYLLEMEAPPDPRVCRQCHTGDGSWKCLDCVDRPVLCSACCRNTHQLNVFHRVEHWNGEFYTPAWLRQVGVIVHLGHNGSKCPSYDHSSHPAGDISDDDGWDDDTEIDVGNEYLHDSPPAATLRDPAGNPFLVLVDRSGVHQLAVRWCQCKGSHPQDIQLLQSGLFPASFGRIRTAFTFKVLDDFLVDNLECKTTAFNFYNKLRRITSKVFPHKVVVS